MLVLAISSPSRAEDLKEAQVHFEAGTKAYELGDYAQAINEYKLSYAAASLPSTLYALGQAFRARGELEAALHFYQQYVARSPKGKYLAAAEQHMQKLEQLIEQKRAAQNRPPRDVPSPPEHREAGSEAVPKAATGATVTEVAPPTKPWFRNTLGWTLASSGLAIVAVGLGITAQGVRYDETAMNGPTLPERLAASADAEAWIPAGATLVSVGAAVVVSGVVVLGVAARRGNRGGR
jgi:tetratricopeptide (TPR) repeat protein